MRRALVALLLLTLISCYAPSEPPLIVASRDSTEQTLLGEIIAQHVENRLKIRVERMPTSSSTQMSHQDLISGQADLMPEYMGDALLRILRLPPSKDSQEIRERLRQEYARQFQAEWTKPLGLHRGFVLVVDSSRGEFSGITRLSQAAERRPGWAFGGPSEFLIRADGTGALLNAYELRWRTPPRTLEGMALFNALLTRQVDLIGAYLTDGQLLTGRYRTLADDRQVLLTYETGIVARTASLDRHPGLREALAELAGKFDNGQMQRMNGAVENDHRPVTEVARQFLTSVHLH